MSGSYRQLQGAAAGELDALIETAQQPHCCPSCGFTWNGQPAPSPLPPLTPEQAALRAHALEPSAARLAAYLRAQLGDTSVFDIWLAPIVLADADHTTLYLAAPAEVASWVTERFAAVLDRAATALAGRPMRCVVASSSTAARRTLGDLATDESAPASTRRPDAGAADTVTGPPERTS